MVFIPALGICRVSQQFLRSGLQAVNVFHVPYDTPDHVGENSAIAELFKNAFLGHNGFMSSEWALAQIETRDVGIEGGPVTITPYLPNIAGGAAAEAAPNQVAVTVTWQSGLAGRSQRGRTFLTGIPEGNAHGTFIDGGLLALIDAYIAFLVSSLEDAGHALQIVSYVHDHAPRVTAQITPVTAYRINTQLATQRRRLTSP